MKFLASRNNLRVSKHNPSNKRMTLKKNSVCCFSLLSYQIMQLLGINYPMFYDNRRKMMMVLLKRPLQYLVCLFSNNNLWTLT